MPHRHLLYYITHFWDLHHNEVLNYGLPTVVSGAAYGIQQMNSQEEVMTTILNHEITWSSFSHFVLIFSFGFTLFKVCREIYKYRLRRNAK
jgi:hypothetical protein